MGQVLLVRHGQASWDADDYDVLSETGWEQSRVLGEDLARRGITVDQVVRGDLRRHRETAEGLLSQMPGEVEVVVDPGWDEFDHLTVLANRPAPFEGAPPSPEAFHAWFVEAVTRWTGGEHDGDYPETWSAFTTRVGAALDRAVARDGTTVVSTSGGTIAWAVATLLADDPVVRTGLWHRLNPVCVNSGVTKLVSGRRGLTLVTLNDHAHLDLHPKLLTYR